MKFLQPLVATVISTLRAPKSSEGYKSIGGGSPLRRITQEQADALAGALQKKGLNASVYVGMRYWKPFTEEAIEQVSAANSHMILAVYACSHPTPRCMSFAGLVADQKGQGHPAGCVTAVSPLLDLHIGFQFAAV